jgi:hypothetical protein
MKPLRLRGHGAALSSFVRLSNSFDLADCSQEVEDATDDKLVAQFKTSLQAVIRQAGPGGRAFRCVDCSLPT